MLSRIQKSSKFRKKFSKICKMFKIHFKYNFLIPLTASCTELCDPHQYAVCIILHQIYVGFKVCVDTKNNFFIMKFVVTGQKLKTF